MNQELDRLEKEIFKNAKVKLYASNNYIGDFLSSMKSRKKPITSEIFGARTSIACHLLNQTYYNQKAITWDPKKKLLPRVVTPSGSRAITAVNGRCRKKLNSQTAR